MAISPISIISREKSIKIKKMGLRKFLLGQKQKCAGQLEEVKKGKFNLIHIFLYFSPVFEKVKANQQKVQEEEAKLQVQINICEEMQHQSEEQNGNEGVKGGKKN